MVGVLRRAYYGLPRFDTRTLLLPLWVNLSLIMLIGDSDNIVYFLIKQAAMPFVILLLCSRTVPSAESTSQERTA
jgi:hypothetical protein